MTAPVARGTTTISDRAFTRIAEKLASEDEHVKATVATEFEILRRASSTSKASRDDQSRRHPFACRSAHDGVEGGLT